MSDWADERSKELLAYCNSSWSAEADLVKIAAALRDAYKAGQKQGEQDGEVADALAVTEKGYDDGYKAGMLRAAEIVHDHYGFSVHSKGIEQAIKAEAEKLDKPKTGSLLG